PAAVRYSVSHQLIDCPQYNSLVCPICGRALTDPSKPNPIHGLDKCVTVEGVGLCGGCAYQLDAEMKRDGVETVLKKYKKET
ncbi:MAG: hypothetical protein IJ334_02115, partial [Clostridia bacterium]|nr:hypothetical protein [Clostridia bacterium]